MPSARATLLCLLQATLAAAPVRVEAVDREDGWPVPGVELRTTHGLRLVSDNAGLIAADIPEAEGKECWFEVIGHGHGVKADGFGYAGVRTPLDAAPCDRPPLDFRYAHFTEPKGGQTAPRGACRLPGDGPTWTTGMVSLTDAKGWARLVAVAAKIRNFLKAYRHDAAEWDESKEEFRTTGTLWAKQGEDDAIPPLREGHPVRWTDGEGRRWVLFCNPFPTLRCPDSYEGWTDRSRWEVIRPPKSVPSAGSTAMRPHTGSIAWHPWLKRWIAVFVERDGKPSALGEVWITQADSPLGPWGCAVKVATHDDHTFYNPRLLAEFFRAVSPVILFKGTYTATLSGNRRPTPRWDYNQVLYQADLSEAAFRTQ
ncbi:MAG: hypothetical protein FJ410_01625 [Verrucomicrobia bacterium]|nr:hypothetical protein [Verrucomicrobiota bacterium]